MTSLNPARPTNNSLKVCFHLRKKNLPPNFLQKTAFFCFLHRAKIQSAYKGERLAQGAVLTLTSSLLEVTSLPSKFQALLPSYQFTGWLVLLALLY